MTYLELEIHIPDKEIINTAHSYLVSTALSSLSQLKSPLMTWIAKERTIIVYIRDRYKQQQQQQQQQQQNINKLEEISHRDYQLSAFIQYYAQLKFSKLLLGYLLYYFEVRYSACSIMLNV